MRCVGVVSSLSEAARTKPFIEVSRYIRAYMPRLRLCFVDLMCGSLRLVKFPIFLLSLLCVRIAILESVDGCQKKSKHTDEVSEYQAAVGDRIGIRRCSCMRLCYC